MTDSRFPNSAEAEGDDPFGSTRWSLVVAAGRGGADAQGALEALCQAYWLPVYAYVRQRCPDVHDAHDLTQTFFAYLLEKNSVSAADPARGRFRAFLLTALKNFLVNEHARAAAKKRGRDRTIVSLDRIAAEERIGFAQTPSLTPEQEFERRWAMILLERVVERLAAEHARAGKSLQFETLRLFLTQQSGEVTQTEAARRLGLTEQAIRAAIYRLRKRYRTLLRDEIAQTLGSGDDIDDELRRLFTAVSF